MQESRWRSAISLIEDGNGRGQAILMEENRPAGAILKELVEIALHHDPAGGWNMARTTAIEHLVSFATDAMQQVADREAHHRSFDVYKHQNRQEAQKEFVRTKILDSIDRVTDNEPAEAFDKLFAVQECLMKLNPKQPAMPIQCPSCSGSLPWSPSNAKKYGTKVQRHLLIELFCVAVHDPECWREFKVRSADVRSGIEDLMSYCASIPGIVDPQHRADLENAGHALEGAVSSGDQHASAVHAAALYAALRNARDHGELWFFGPHLRDMTQLNQVIGLLRFCLSRLYCLRLGGDPLDVRLQEQAGKA